MAKGEYQAGGLARVDHPLQVGGYRRAGCRRCLPGLSARPLVLSPIAEAVSQELVEDLVAPAPRAGEYLLS
jgi:hypothetical protein